MNYWIITVKEPYCGCILRGIKTMEIRKAIPLALNTGDVIFIVRKGEKGHIVGACGVTSILKESVSYFLNYRREEHRVKAMELKEYASDRRSLYGIGLTRMRLDDWCLNVRSFGYDRAPQNFYHIRPEYMSTIERVLYK